MNVAAQARISGLDILSIPKRLWAQIYHRKSQRKTIRYGLIALNFTILLVASVLVIRSSNAEPVSRQNAIAGTPSTSQENPLDALSSADIAVHIARLTRLPEATAVVNEADSVNAQLAVVATGEKVVAKPQVVSTANKSIKDLKAYTTVAGDTVSQLASKFGVTSDTIKWSNDLTGDSLAAGKVLQISPVDGLVYTVKAGDTPDSIAQKYKADKARLIDFNDIEVTGLKPGQKIVVPEGKIVTVVAAPSSSSAFTFAYIPYASGGYDRGWCTDYASRQGGAPGGWGNANTWDNYAPLSGWTVSKTPVVGAIAQTDAGWAGHVGIVDAVSEDGTMIKYSDMNGLAGFGRVGYSDWVPVHSKFQNFIYH